ncbi:MAG TPA: hypothetical protein VIH58_06165, partial [Chthoniobacterales bacterium]
VDFLAQFSAINFFFWLSRSHRPASDRRTGFSEMDIVLPIFFDRLGGVCADDWWRGFSGIGGPNFASNVLFN